METPPPAPAGRRRGPLLLAVAGALALVVLVVVVVLAGGGNGPEVDRFAGPGEPGEPPPDDTSESAAPADGFEYWDGSPGSLADFAGEPVVLNFFASWCAPCVAEMPDFEEVHEQVGSDVRFVGVNQNDQREAAQEIIERTGITYEVIRDDGTLFESLEALIMPTTVLVTADGRVVRVHSGAMDQEQLRTAIDEELLT